VSRAGLFEVLGLARKLKDTREVFAELVRRHGDVVRIRLGPSVFFLLAHPDDVREVLETHADRFERMGGELRVSRRISGDAVSATEGDRHSRERSALEPVLYGPAAEASAAGVVELAARWRETLEAGKPFDAWAAMERFCTELIVRLLTGLDPSQGRGRAIVESLISTVAALDSLPGGPTGLSDRLGPLRRGFERERAALDALLAETIAEHRSNGGRDLLTLLVQTHGAGGGGETDLQLRNHLVALYRGHTATSTALALAWWQLGREPEVETAVLDEVDALGGQALTFADLGALGLTTRTFQEAIRLFPPAWVLARKVVADHVAGGEPIRRGSKIFVSEWLVHRDPRFWDEPLRFRPERFEPDAVAGRHPYAYFPQGGGNNLCIGHRMVVPMEAPLIMATVAQRWRLRPVPGREPDLAPRATLKPKDGVWLVPQTRAEARSPD
jgi:cytochrome P450